VATTPVAAATINVPGDYPTIQAAVNAANPAGGDTIVVAAGTYTENIDINKPVVLRGPNASVDPNTGTRVAEAIISSSDQTLYAIRITSTEVTVDGFSIEGPNSPASSSSVTGAAIVLDYPIATTARDNIHIQYNCILRTAGGTNWRGEGIRMYLPNASASVFVEHNLIAIPSKESQNLIGDYQKGNNDLVLCDTTYWQANAATWALTNPRRVTVKDNYFYGHSKVYLINCLGALVENNVFLGYWGPFEVAGCRDVIIKGNSMVDQTDVGILAWSPKQVAGVGLCEDIRIENNNIDGMLIDAPARANPGTAIVLGGVKNAIVVGNDIRNNADCGIVIAGEGYAHFGSTSDVGPYQPVNNVIHFNNIEGNTNFGVEVHASVTSGMPFDATCNWWGAADGPDGGVGPGSGDKVSANVNYDPWLTEPYTPQKSVTPTTGGTAYFDPDQGSIEALAGVAAPVPRPVVLPYGLFSFQVCCIPSGGTVTLTVTLPGPVPKGSKWWKYQGGSWYSLPIGSDDGDNIITVTLTDNGSGDEDPTPGLIMDDGGPGTPGAVGWETYPTDKVRVLLPWILLGAAIAVGASLLVLRRRRTLT